MRQTSLAAYNEIKASGLLSRMRWIVYDHLYHHGPLTRTEVDLHLKRDDEVNPSYHKRLSELERAGVVTTVGRKTCSITGKECELWDVTDALPVPVDPNELMRPTRKELVEAASELRGIYRSLRRWGHPGFSDNLLRVCRWMASR
jgi:hypothetical protein